MNIEFFILFIGLILVVIGYAKQISVKDREIEVKYMPRNVYDEFVMNAVL